MSGKGSSNSPHQLPRRGKRFSDSVRDVKFCPWCGIENLIKDEFNPAAKKANGEYRKTDLHAWICNACHRGFVVRPSPRAEFARHMMREDTRQRGRSDFEAIEVAKIRNGDS